MKKKIYLICSMIFLLFLTACNGKVEKEKDIKEKVPTIEETIEEESKETSISYHKVGGDGTVMVQFSTPVENVGDLKSKILITPQVEAEFSMLGNTKLLIHGDFETNKEYLCDLSELTGDMKDVINFSFQDKKEIISFEEPGILFPREKKSLSLRTMNIDSVELKVYKIFANNMNSFVNSFDFTRGGDYFYGFKNRLDELGEVVYETSAKIDGEKNKTGYLKLDFDKTFDENGIYAIEVIGKPMDKKSFRRVEAEKLVIKSDIGIMGKKLPKELEVQLVSISSRNPIKNGKVFLMAKNNQVLEEGITDKTGLVRFRNSIDKGYYLKVKKGGDINLLKLTNKLPLDSFKTGGIKTVESNQIYTYTDRPEYRPGDEIHGNIIIRQDGKPLEKGHPVKVTWIDAEDHRVSETLEWNENSFYTISKKIPLNGVTGVWAVEVEVGDNVSYLSIPVEATISKKLESNLKVDGDVLNLKSHYLYGNPSPDQVVKGKGTFVMDEKRFLNYEDFRFSLPNEKSKKDFEFQIDLKDGVGKKEVKIEEMPSLSWNMKIYWEAIVLDENGRPNPTYAVTNVDKYNSFIGIKDYHGEYFPVGENKRVPIVVLDKNGEKVGGHKVKYRIYQRSSVFWYDYYDEDDSVSLKNSKSARLIEEGDLVSSSKKSMYVDVPDLNEGTVYIEVTDLETDQKASTSYRLSYWADSQKFQEVSKLRMSSDKDEYKVGDTATILWEGNKGSKAYVTFEKDGKIFRRDILNLSSDKGEIKLKITKDMVPNVYVNIILLQDYKEYSNDRPARLYGVLPIMVRDTAHDAKINVELPKKVQSNGELVVDVSNGNHEEMEYAISVVDLGLLQENGYKIPDPHGYFFGKRGYLASLYDNYTILLEKNRRKADTILKVGGGDAYEENSYASLAKAMGELRERELGIEKANRFKNLALYKGILKSDEKGNLRAKFKLPRYQGAIKVIVTGVNKDKYGVNTCDAIVSSPVIMQNSLPRTLKIGDVFTVSSRLLQKDPEITGGVLIMEFESEIRERKIDFTSDRDQLIKESFKVNGKIGTEKVKVTFAAKKGNKTYRDQDVIEIDVNSINPYSYVAKFKKVEPNGTYKIPLPKNIIQGSDRLSISVSTTKRYGIDRRLNDLIKYPYGCSEQITSIGMVKLYLKELETAKLLDEKDIRDDVNRTLLKLRNNKKKYSFSYWENSSVVSPFSWLDNYICEFVVRAKEEGYYVNDEFYTGIVKMLNDSSIQNKDMSEKVYAIWILSKIQEGSISEMNYVRESMYESLDLTDKWLLLAAYANQGEEDYAREKAKDLILFEEGASSWDLGLRSESYRNIYGELPKKYSDKLIERLSSLDSYDTYSTARILMGLVEKPVGGRDSKFILNGKEVKTESGLYAKTYTGNNKAIISNSGKEPLYVYSFWEGKKLDNRQEGISQGVNLLRSEISDTFKQGDVVSWTLTLSRSGNSSVDYLDDVAVVEILPSALEWEIDRDDLYNIGAEYVDIRDDRLIVVFPYVNSEEIRIPLKARAITEGKYNFPGATAEEIYHSNVRAQLVNTMIEVVK